MADGDVSVGTVNRWPRVDNLVVAFDGGHLAGQTWRVRCFRMDGYERSGPFKWINQAGADWADAWWQGAGGRASVVERGVDQWGRLVGEVRADGPPLDYELAAIAEGYAFSQSATVDGDTYVLSSDPRLAGYGDGADLRVDRLRP